jgi:dienelactone hydrolase
MMKYTIFSKVSIFFAIFCVSLTHAKIVEEVIAVPVVVKDEFGKVHAHTLRTFVYYDDELPSPHPVAIIGHGRAVQANIRANLKPSTYANNAKWFAQLGYLVAIPTRIGYGETGGDDIEDTGSCSRKNFPPAYRVGAEQTIQLLTALRQRPDVAKEKGIVIGQSMGGPIAIATAALNVPGVQAVINFAGGGGGNPDLTPGQPCRADSLERLYSNYGKTSRIPTLWVYTENDQYWGAQYPKDWFAAFKANGGNGQYILLPANGKDGHSVFTRDSKAWRPQVLEFLKANGLAP